MDGRLSDVQQELNFGLSIEMDLIIWCDMVFASVVDAVALRRCLRKVHNFVFKYICTSFYFWLAIGPMCMLRTKMQCSDQKWSFERKRKKKSVEKFNWRKNKKVAKKLHLLSKWDQSKIWRRRKNPIRYSCVNFLNLIWHTHFKQAHFWSRLGK